jgi:hypothetical protein
VSLLLLLDSPGTDPNVALALYTGEAATPSATAGGASGSAMVAGSTNLTLTVNAAQPAHVSSPVYTATMAVPSMSTLATAVTNNVYVEFTVTAAAGGTIDIDHLDIEIAKGGTAGTARGMGLRADDDGFTNGLTYDGTGQVSLAVTAVRGTNPMEVHRWDCTRIPPAASVTFRVYFFASASGHNLDFDNLRVVGTPISTTQPVTGTSGIGTGEAFGAAGTTALTVYGDSLGIPSAEAFGATGSQVGISTASTPVVTSVATAASTASSTTIVPALGAGWLTGDLVFLIAALSTTTGAIDTPSGWNVAMPETASTGAATSHHMAIFWLPWTSGMTLPTLNSVGTGRWAVITARLRGSDQTTPVVGLASTSQAVAGATIDAPGQTSSTSPLLVTVHSARHGTNGTQITWTPPSGMTELDEITSTATSTSNVAIELSSLVITPGATTGVKTATADSTVTGGRGVSFTVAPGVTASPSITGTAGIGTAEAFGAAGLVQAQVVGTAGLASAETFGTGGTAQLQAAGSAGLSSAEAFGTTGGTVSQAAPQPVTGTAGLPTAETFGAGGTTQLAVAGTVGLASAGAFGTTGATAQLQAAGTAGLPSAGAFGAGGTATLGVAGTAGVGSLETVGTAGTVQVATSGSAGIPSAEAFGADGTVAATLAQAVTGTTGIPTGEVVGTAGTAALQVSGTSGVPTAETVGTAGAVAASIAGTAGIASGQAFGAGGVAGLSVVGAAGLVSPQAFGVTSAAVQLQANGTAGIASAEQVGSGTVTATTTGTAGIPSALAFGAGGSVATGLAGTTGIVSAEAFGAGTVTLQLAGTAGIPSAEAFGAGTVQALALLSITGTTGIGSAEAFGTGLISSVGAAFVGTFTGSGTASGTGAAGQVSWTVTTAMPAGTLVYLGAAGRNVTGVPFGTFTDKTSDTRGNPWTTTYDARSGTYLNVTAWALLQTALQVGDTITIQWLATPSTTSPVYPPGVAFSGVISPVENLTRGGTEGATTATHGVVSTTATDLFVGFWAIEGDPAAITGVNGGMTLGSSGASGTARFGRFYYRKGSPSDQSYSIATSTAYSGLARGYTFTDALVGNGGIPSAEGFGADGQAGLVAQAVTGTAGIPSAELVGSGTIRLAVQGAAGIPTAEAVGTGTATLAVVGTSGITSAQAFGAGTVTQAGTQQVTGTSGVTSAEAFGTTGGMVRQNAVTAVAGTSGIPSDLTFGTGTVVLQVQGATGLGSGLAFGAAGILRQVVRGLLGIPSEQAFGQDGGLSQGEDIGLDLDFQVAGPYLVVLHVEGPTAVENAASGPMRAEVVQVGPRAAQARTEGPARATLVVTGPKT